jgi:hypothetical protein
MRTQQHSGTVGSVWMHLHVAPLTIESDRPWLLTIILPDCIVSKLQADLGVLHDSVSARRRS